MRRVLLIARMAPIDRIVPEYLVHAVKLEKPAHLQLDLWIGRIAQPAAVCDHENLLTAMRAVIGERRARHHLDIGAGDVLTMKGHHFADPTSAHDGQGPRRGRHPVVHPEPHSTQIFDGPLGLPNDRAQQSCFQIGSHSDRPTAHPRRNAASGQVVDTGELEHVGDGFSGD